jgi:N-acetylglucosaminyl-diphospho-decaprenol L-rhamnosyltransferase
MGGQRTPATTVVIPTAAPRPSLERLLRSLAGSAAEPEVIVVDNDSGNAELTALATAIPQIEVLSLERNEGYSRAVNRGARRASGEALVLLNDDCIVDPGYLEAITSRLDPAAGIVMAAGVMREHRDRFRIDSAGMELDRTLLAFDYLNGEPVSLLDRSVPDPIGPSGAAAAFDRAAFLGAGGFDERLFAYWEDVDLVLRLHRAGGRCRLAGEARGIHEHSATLGPGSARKNYLTGFGRGYVLRKWGVVSPRRAPSILVRDLAICAGQGIVDRNLAGVRGRLAGYRAARREYAFPGAAIESPGAPGPVTTLARRARRRARLRRRSLFTSTPIR